MKYLILFLITVGSLFYIRHKASGLAQTMYTEGCKDAAAVLAKEGKVEAAADVMLYCTWKKKTMNTWM